jgi:putative tricarboxylic transport membrane protein
MRWPERVFALGLVALGVIVLVGTRQIEFGSGYDRIGPRFFPYGVAAGLIAIGIWLTFRPPPRSGFDEDGVVGSGGGPLIWVPLGYLGLAFVLQLLLLDRAGFVIAGSLQFILAARAFHSRRPLRDAIVGIILCATIYVAFSKGLSLVLPAGILEGLL